ncbi:hypothetical protein MC81_10590 [Achromobacter insolitus]|nr:hypothetical protein MC81_10590 [Achromobacter insolitus]
MAMMLREGLRGRGKRACRLLPIKTHIARYAHRAATMRGRASALSASGARRGPGAGATGCAAWRLQWFNMVMGALLAPSLWPMLR